MDGSKAYPTTPVLKLDVDKIAAISTGGPQGLSYMWTVFSKCRESIADGQRLENLSWRLWYEDLRVGAGRRSPSFTESESETETADGSALSDLSDVEEVDEEPVAQQPSQQAGTTTEAPIFSTNAHEGGQDAASCSSATATERDQRSSDTFLAQPQDERPPRRTSRSTVPDEIQTTGTGSDQLRPKANAALAGSPHRFTPNPRRSSAPATNERKTFTTTSSPSSVNGKPAPASPAAPATNKRQHRASTCISDAEYGPRIRTHSSLTPVSLKSIIAEVLPIDFKSAPSPTSSCIAKAFSSTNIARKVPSALATTQSARIDPKTTPSPTLPISPRLIAITESSQSTPRATAVPSSNPLQSHPVPQPVPTSSSSSSSPLASTSMDAPPAPPEAAEATSSALLARPLTSPTQGILKRPSSALSTNSSIRVPSIKSERSFVSSSTSAARSDLAVDPVFSPKTRTSPLAVREGPDTASAPQTIVSPPAESIALPTNEGGEGQNATYVPRSASSQKVSRGNLDRVSSSSRLQQRLGVPRTQSAKSVRILESPTNEEGASSSSSTGSAFSNIAPKDETSASATKKGGLKKKSGSSSRLATKVFRTSSSSKLSKHHRTNSSGSLASRSIVSDETLPAKSSNIDIPEEEVEIDVKARDYIGAGNIATKPLDIGRSGSSTSIRTSKPGESRNGGQSQQQESVPITAASMQAAADAVPQPPPSSPASPVVQIPASVILPRQPYPSPSDARYGRLSSTRRPVSPPTISEDPDVTTSSQPEESVPEAGRPVRSTVAEERSPAKHSAGPVPRPLPAVAAAAAPTTAQQRKKSNMFFLSSPTTDSDDESFGRSQNRTKKVNKPSPMSPKFVQSEQGVGPSRQQQQGQEALQPAQPRIMEPPEHSDEEDDDEDESDWSSDISESSEDPKAAAVKREDERQRDLFAKRVPSQVNVSGGLLSQMLHPEDYPRGHANLPAHLRNNKSAVELARARPSGHLQGLDKASDNISELTVTGMHASKSTAVLSAMNRPNLKPTASGNQLSRLRLGGKPSGVELESSDEDEEDDDRAGKGEFTPSQHVKLANLMHKRAPNNAQKAAASSTSVVEDSVLFQPAPLDAFSPRTTRRNMLATELTESLRINMILERQSQQRLAGAGSNRPAAAASNKVLSKHNINAVSGQSGSEPSHRPQVLRGSSRFNDQTTTQPAARPPLSGLRSSSDPPAPQQPQQEYYSPGFHHVGW